MKKSLFALAALTAFAGAASAQSSVTVYGILDVGYIGGNSSAVVNSTATKTTGNAFSDSAQSTSRLGFKGTEDLGGGLSAFFTIEQAITPDSSSAFSSGATANRQTFVGLKKNGIGDFAFGTQYTPIHNAVSATDAGQANNMVGDVIYPINSKLPGAAAAAATVGATGQDNNASYTVRVNNSLTVNSANFAGFQAHGLVVANNSNTNQTVTNSTTVTGGTNNQNGWGLGADYTWNKLFATANYQSLSATNPYAPAVPQASSSAAVAAVGSPTVFGVGGASALGTNVHDNQGYVAATYDFGILKAYAQWVTRKVTYSENSGYYVKRQAEQIGVRSFITPTIEGWASAGLGRYTAYGTGQPTANFNAWQLGANYWLSKRTNLYAIVGAENTSNYSTVSASGTATGTNSLNTNGYALGVRHTF